VTSSVSVEKSASSEVARQIARAAARLFAARGYDATSVREIVEAAGVTKPTLYYHFGSKEGLAQALLTVPLNEMLGRLRQALEGTGDPVERLARFFEVQLAFCREDPDIIRFFNALWFGPRGTGLEAAVRPLVEDLMKCGQSKDTMLTEAVRPLADAGLIAADRVDDFAAACRGLIIMSMFDFLYRGTELKPGLGRRLVDDLLFGFGRFEDNDVKRGVTR
jgi:AcrR family transcriptional regulator